jgi:pseudomonalisin
MTFNSNLKMLPIAATLAATFSPASHATESEWVKTQTHAADLSAAKAGDMMKAGEAVHVSISLQVRNKEELDALTDDLMTGRSDKIISSDYFLARYAPTPDQVDAVVKHLTQSGFTNVKVAKNKMMITADGTAGAAKAGFKVDMQHFTVTDHINGVTKERTAYASVSDAVVPQSLEKIVLSVHGLQTFTQAHFNVVKAQPMASSSGSEKSHNPSEWPKIYGGTNLPTASNTTIGIIASGNMTQTQTDLNAFARQAGFPIPETSVVGGGGASTSGTIEWDTDSQDSLGSAGGQVKSMVFYAAASLSDADLNNDYNTAVSDNVAKVINISLGECETDAKTDGTEATDDQIFETAVAQGQTIVVASGDGGSYECSGSKNQQSYPAVSPYVIAVGGTTLYTTAADAWANETAWSGSGGGVSTTEKAPNWQISSKVLGTSTYRGVPDVAFDANPSSGVTLTVNGQSEQLGGTSLAAPIFAGFWARIQSAHNNKLSFPAQAIYQYGPANEATIFHDITSGSNGGYSAKKGWDYVTGFGSLNVNNFASFVSSHSGF